MFEQATFCLFERCERTDNLVASYVEVPSIVAVLIDPVVHEIPVNIVMSRKEYVHCSTKSARGCAKVVSEPAACRVSISSNTITIVGYPADMAVESFDPGSMRPALTPALLAELVALADRLDQPGLGLDTNAVRRTTAVARHGNVDWAAAAGTLSDADLIALIRVFTKGEKEVSGWEAGAKSPVILLVRELKKRGTYPAELTSWIKANSENRFLPHGSLMDRLK